MDPRANPYHAAPGVTPAYLGGRKSELDLIDLAFSRLQAGITDKHPIFAGNASSGKTALLNVAAQRAKAKGWTVASLEAKAGYSITEDILENIYEVLDKMDKPDRTTSKLKSILDRIRSFQVSVLGNGIGASWSPSSTPATPIGNLFDALGEVMKSHKTAIVFCIDEMDQLSSPELQMILSAMHRVNQLQSPIIFVGAGNNDLRTKFVAAKGYGSLFAINYLYPLSKEEAAKVLTAPLATYGPTYTEDALNYIVDRCQGEPYLLQLYGEKAWDLAPQLPIDFDVAQQAHQQCLETDLPTPPPSVIPAPSFDNNRKISYNIGIGIS